MKSKTIFLFLLLSMFLAAQAKPVSEKQAREIGARFLNGTMKLPTLDPDALRLVKTYRCATGEEAFFVFNTETGFVIVAANDYAAPIIGYSNEGPLFVDDLPVQLQDYLNGFLRQIEYGVAHGLAADETIAAQWDRIRTPGKPHPNRAKGPEFPLLKENWSQGNPYNRYCPADPAGPGQHVYTGCVATAMAQIMHYWKYPEKGQGSHSYTPYFHPEYGVQFADFSATTYHWDLMPNKLTLESSEEEIDAVATLMYHCGVSVNMMYDPAGSGAFTSDVPSALANYFRYPDDLKLINREDDSLWMADLKASLDAYRPVYYAGQGSTGGHAFVCDGYDENDLLHFNWGWGGNGDGYFALDGHAYSGSNAAIVNIHGAFDPDHTCQVSVTLNAENVGVVSGDGTYLYGDLCTLTAQAFDGCKFRAWFEDGVVVSKEPEYTFMVLEDRHLEAFFDGEWSAQVEAACIDDQAHHAQSAEVSWVNGSPVSGDIHDEWPLLKSFSFYQLLAGVAVDGNHIYTSSTNSMLDSVFYKWDYEGNLIESFTIEGSHKVPDLTYDGRYFYGGWSYRSLFCLDFANKTLVDVVPNSWATFGCCAYDPDHDGFWLSDGHEHKLQLVDRQGLVLQEGPSIETGRGAAYYKNNRGEPHLLYLDSGKCVVYDYDINADTSVQCQVLDGNNYIQGIFIGAYYGKTALFVNFYNKTLVYEIPVDLSQVQLHRIYRVEGAVGEQGPLSDPELIADRRFGASYTDLALDTLASGTYSYGVSLLTDGLESEIHWSNPIEHVRHYAIGAHVNNEEGGTVSGQGWYWEGEECVLTATASPHYVFTGWLQNGDVVSTDSVFRFSVTEDADYLARFEWNMAEIEVLVTPPETGTVTGQGSYDKGSVCTLTAIPAPKYAFLEWQKNGVVVSTEAEYRFTVTEDAAYVARFEQAVFEIQVVVAPQGSGEVKGAGTYNKGDTVTLIVSPQVNYHFVKWMENNVTVSNEATLSFEATCDRTLVAKMLYNYAIEEQEGATFSLYPSPAHDRLVVESPEPVRSCEILSVTGVLVYRRDEANESCVAINVSDLPSGLYLIRLVMDGYSLTGKFVKQ